MKEKTEEQTRYDLNTWWVSREYDEKLNGAYYQLHGNNGLHGSGNPHFFEGEIITSSRIENVTIQDGRFLFKTQNSIYSCEILDHLNERFEWLFDQTLWKNKLPEEELRQQAVQLEQEMRNVLLSSSCKEEKRKKSPTELDQDRYCLMAFSNEYKHYIADVLYCHYGKQRHPEIFIIKQPENKLTYVDVHSVCTEEEPYESAIYYEITGSNTIILRGAAFMYIPVYVSNYGKECLYFDTFFGRYRIPSNGRLYRIAAQATNRRVAYYQDEEQKNKCLL